MSVSALGTSGATRLSQMYENQFFGRARLEGLLASCIPNMEHDPGTAHQQLVRLLLGQIFLPPTGTRSLERAVDSYDRSYAIVNQPTQITTSPAPRIVKLHGSLDAGSRLIFTESDFRTYPVEYSPFVSLVQQSLTENIFVLIGFSGEDPNFLTWHGWARDRLGSYLQHVYLVSSRAPDPAERALLLSRRINVLDLSSLPGNTYPERLVNFFAALARLKVELRQDLRWPARTVDARGASGEHLASFQALVEQHPGWAAAPKEKRTDLLKRLWSTLQDANILTAAGEMAWPASLGLVARERAAIAISSALILTLCQAGPDLRLMLDECFSCAILDVGQGLNLAPPVLAAIEESLSSNTTLQPGTTQRFFRRPGASRAVCNARCVPSPGCDHPRTRCTLRWPAPPGRTYSVTTSHNSRRRGT